MDRDTLIRAMGNHVISDEECAAFNAAMIQAGCTTVDRAAMFCAQIGHESVGLRYYEEIWGPSPDQLTYQGRMGNINPGDGFRFRGRGPIQVTGRDNYTAVSQWAYEQGYVATVDAFVAAPDLLSSIGFGFYGAAWYWSTQRPLNDLSDRRDIEGATRAINGGLNGLEDRRHRYSVCLALGEALLPDEGEGSFMAGEARDVQQQLRGPELNGWDQLGGRTVVDATADIRDQLTGPDHRFGGWSQLGGRTLVDAIAKIGEHLGIEGFEAPKKKA